MLCKMLVPHFPYILCLTHAEAFIKGVFAELNAKTSTFTRHMFRSVIDSVRLHIDYAKDGYKTTGTAFYWIGLGIRHHDLDRSCNCCVTPVNGSECAVQIFLIRSTQQPATNQFYSFLGELIKAHSSC